MNIKVSLTRQENAEFFNAKVGDTVEVDFEDYIAAVVASEIGNSPIEACRAQAIAARSFAVRKGVLNGKVISDSSSTAQAFRAKRNNPDTYPNSVEGANDTEGLVLTYKGNVIDAVYSSNNGGRTTSSKERWGNTCAYLIEQDDPWDAADGRTKTGHGVGMSQRGAMYAANHGANYTTILSFYYPGTTIVENYGRGQEVVKMENKKANDIVEIAMSKLGDPYVYGAWGDPCTPSVRKQYAGYHPEYREKIYGACQSLSGKGKCATCKWNNHLCYDCRGFMHYCIINGSGIDLYGGGATTQYDTNSNWEEKGLISNAPNLVFPVFKRKGDRMSHTGIHIGDGKVIHCSTTVKEGSLTDSTWTHYAIPKGLYTKEEIEKAESLQVVINKLKGVTTVSYNPITDGFIYKAKVVASSGNTVNMRSSASTSASILKKISLGTEVYVIEEINSAWSKIGNNGMVGYMMSKFLERVQSDNNTQETTYSPAVTIELDDMVEIPRALAEQLFAALKDQVK